MAHLFATALALRILIALVLPGSYHDVGWWVVYGQAPIDLSPYGFDSFTFPPPWHWVCRLCILTGLPERFAVRLPAILADLALMLFLARRFGADRRLMIWLGFTSPLVWCSAVHGQLDSVAALPAVLAFALVLSPGNRLTVPAALAGLALGIAIKKWPMILIPAFAIGLEARGWSRWSAIAASSLTLVPAVLLTWWIGGGSVAILKKVFVYGGVHPWWGPYAALELVRKASGSSAIQQLMHAVSRTGALLFLAAVGAMWLFRWRGRDAGRCAVLTLALFEVLAVNVAPYYTAWVVAFVALDWSRGNLDAQRTRALRIVLLAQTLAGLAYINAYEYAGGFMLKAAHGANCAVSALCWLWWVRAVTSPGSSWNPASPPPPCPGSTGGSPGSA
jgi:hypothetical protein